MSSFAGIDISAQTLDVAWVDGSKRAVWKQFEQSPAGHRQLVCYLKRCRVEAIVMEATGVYYLDAALVLHDAGLPVSVINPRAAHHFAKVLLQSSKTDRIDAELLAEYAKRMDLAPWQAPDSQWLALRDIARRINQLTRNRTAEKNRLHALQSKRFTAKILIEEVKDTISQLDRHIERLAIHAWNLIQSDAELARLYAVLTSAKGIGQTSAVAVIGEICLLPKSMRSAQITCYAGLDVRLSESGTSVQRPGRLSKAGNAWLRSGLFMPTLSFIRHDPYAQAHYQALIARGKKKIQAVCAVERKLLTGLWACIRTDTTFDSAKLFAIQLNST